MPVVYIDLLFLMNFLMNSVTLYCTSLLLKRAASLTRTALAATILAIYSSVMFFPNIKFIYSLLGKIFILSACVSIAFPAKSCTTLIKNSLVFFAVNAIFAGIMFALIFATDFGTTVGAAVSNGEIYLNIKASSVILSILPAYSVAFVISYIKKENIKRNVNLADIEITFNKNRIKIKGFEDTGCGLCEPLSRKPAIIISKTAAKTILPTNLFEALQNGVWEDIDQYRGQITILPYCTVGENFGILYGFNPDSIIINNIKITTGIIAVTKYPLCDNEQYDAIFNPEILSAENTNTYLKNPNSNKCFNSAYERI